MATARELSFVRNNSADYGQKTSKLKCVRSDNLFVAAIDIGNTCTRCVYSLVCEPSKAYLCNISSEDDLIGHCYTAVVLDDNGRFDSFGYSALRKYKNEQKGHLFRDIKQPLYEATGISSDIYVSDELGRQTKAVTVFKAIIQQVVELLSSHLNRFNIALFSRDIYWILTVPAAFTKEAISVIEKSATQAGIPEECFGIVLEPVASLEYCLFKKETERRVYRNRHEPASPVTDMFSGIKKYIVVDIGEKTLDATVLEKDPLGNVKELHKGCDMGLGGNALHKILDNLLSSIVGLEVFSCFQTVYDIEYNCMHRDFSAMLKSSSFDTRTNLRLGLPVMLRYGVCLKDVVNKSPYAEEISATQHSLEFPTAFLKNVLAEYCLTLVTFLKAVLQTNVYEITDILLVGGYANIKTLKETVMREFPGVDVSIPVRPENATVHGAVLLALKPRTNVEHDQNTCDTIKESEYENTSDNVEDNVEDDQSRGSDVVESIRKISLSSDNGADNTSKLHSGLMSLNNRIKGAPQKIVVRCKEIIADVIAAYREIDISRPLDICFDGEENKEVTEEMFGIFWETLTHVWFTGEDAFIPKVPVGKVAEARQVFPILGKVLEHMLCILGYFPPQLCRSFVLTIADKDVDTELVMEDYLSYLPQRESELLTLSLKQTKWSENTQKRLQRFFSVRKISCNPMSFKEDLQNIAYEELIDSSCMYSMLIRRGISDFAKAHFFDLLDSKSLTAEYRTREPTSENVPQLVESALDDQNYSREEKICLNFIINIISGLSKGQLRRFLIWLTGSPNMPEKIEVSFRPFCGGSKTPVPHRDRNILELTTEYNSCQELKRALLHEINNEFFSLGVHY